jgi:hypothetical protein
MGNKIAIMQPYFIPYIGYFQLINSVDIFVVYDNIKYTKKGWINRNRILVNGKDQYISLPLKKDSDYLFVNQRFLSENFEKDKLNILNKIKECYCKSPNFKEVFYLLEEIFNFKTNNLFDFIYNSIKVVCNYLEIKTQFIISSTVDINHNLKSEEKVLEICKALKSSVYINPIGGVNLYNKSSFIAKDVELLFLKSDELIYRQFENEFLTWLSIVDVLMFNNRLEIKKTLNNYKLL